MVKKCFIVLTLFLLLFFFSSGVYAQSKPIIVIEHITDHPVLVGAETKPDSKVKLVNTIRAPNVDDVTDAMKKKKKVTIVILLSNATAKWAHAVRIVAINLTSYNSTDLVNNKTNIFYDAEVYDPATNTTYNLTFAYIHEENKTGYLSWGSGVWAPMREVITMYKSPLDRFGSLISKPTHFAFLPFIDYKKIIVFPKFHFH